MVEDNNLTPNPFPSGKGNRIVWSNRFLCETGDRIVWSNRFLCETGARIVGSNPLPRWNRFVGSNRFPSEILFVLLPFPLGKGPGVRFYGASLIANLTFRFPFPLGKGLGVRFSGESTNLNPEKRA